MATIGNNMEHGHSGDAVKPTSDEQTLPAPDEAVKHGSFIDMEWLRTPGLIMMVIGMLGLLSVATERTAWLVYFRFPPVWSCCIILCGGVVFSVLASVSYMSRCGIPLKISSRKSWRSL